MTATMLSTLNIGPVSTQPYNVTAEWSSESNVKGFRGASFGGVMLLAHAYTLSELVPNPAERQTIGGVSGVLEYISSDSPVLSHFNGYYLLQTFRFVPDKIGADARFAGFSLGAVLIGDLP